MRNWEPCCHRYKSYSPILMFALTPNIPEVRTVCVSSARTGLCGGQWVQPLSLPRTDGPVSRLLGFTTEPVLYIVKVANEIFPVKDLLRLPGLLLRVRQYLKFLAELCYRNNVMSIGTLGSVQ